MTAVEWLIEQIKKEHPFWTSIFEQAKQFEKQQIIDAWNDGYGGSAHSEDEYYNETYGSKGSDDHIVDTNEMVEDTYKVWESLVSSGDNLHW